MSIAAVPPREGDLLTPPLTFCKALPSQISNTESDARRVRAVHLHPGAAPA